MGAAECGSVLMRYAVKGSDLSTIIPPSAYRVRACVCGRVGKCAPALAQGAG